MNGKLDKVNLDQVENYKINKKPKKKSWFCLCLKTLKVFLLIFQY